MNSHIVSSILCAFLVTSVAIRLGIFAPELPSQSLPVGLSLTAYSVFDVAIVSLWRSINLMAIYNGIIDPDSRAYRFSFYFTQSFLFAKILIRIAVEDYRELPTVTIQDELLYGIVVFVFLIGLIDHMILVKKNGSRNSRVDTTSMGGPNSQPLIEITSDSSTTQPTSASATAATYNKVTVRKLLGIVIHEKILLIIAFSCLVIAAICQAYIPHFIGQALDSVKTGSFDDVQVPLFGLVKAATGYAVFAALRGSSFILLGARTNVRMRERLFSSILSQEIGFFDKTKTGDLSSRMTQDIQKVCDQVQFNVNYFLRNFIATFVTITFMVSLSWRLTCLSLMSIPAVVVIAQQYGEFMKKISKSIQDALADCNSSSEETFSSIHTVRSFGAEDYEINKFKNLITEVYRLSVKSARMYIPYLGICIALPYGASILIIFYGSKLAHAGVIDPAVLISFVLYLEMLNDSFGAMGDIYASITSALGAAEKIFAILERSPEFPREEFPLVPPTINVKGTIEFRNVTFSYPTRSHIQTLQGISMTIPAGSVAALVGPSGQGKSTCLALLQRWYCQTSGEILMDNVGIRRYEHHLYHRIVSCVNQEPLLFARSVRENILFGIINPGDPVSEELETRVIEASKLACAHKFISAMPEGYNTQVGMRGVQLSGGQKQRIAIARALVRNPKILLLDEATSALDSESEHQVQAALDSLIRTTAGGITTIIVAHRLSTVRNADCIYLIDKGQVVEKGKHDDLVSNEHSAYYKLVSNQLLTSSGSGTNLSGAAAVQRSSSTSSMGQ